MLLIPFYGSGLRTSIVMGSTITISAIIELLLMTRNFKQLFQLDWKATIKGTIKTYFYMMVSFFALLITSAILLGLLVIGIIALVDLFR